MGTLQPPPHPWVSCEPPWAPREPPCPPNGPWGQRGGTAHGHCVPMSSPGCRGGSGTGAPAQAGAPPTYPRGLAGVPGFGFPPPEPAGVQLIPAAGAAAVTSCRWCHLSCCCRHRAMGAKGLWPPCSVTPVALGPPGSSRTPDSSRTPSLTLSGGLLAVRGWHQPCPPGLHRLLPQPSTGSAPAAAPALPPVCTGCCPGTGGGDPGESRRSQGDPRGGDPGDAAGSRGRQRPAVTSRGPRLGGGNRGQSEGTGGGRRRRRRYPRYPRVPPGSWGRSPPIPGGGDIAGVALTRGC